ncbi:7227_t:CDS:2, partial [Diversispora eburnea]
NIPLTKSINTVVNEENIAEDIAESSNQALPINEDINEVVNLYEGHVFSLWEEVDKFVKAYGKQQGFGVARKRLERHPNSNIKHRSYRCEFSGHSQPKKKVNARDHCNCKSKCQECR